MPSSQEMNLVTRTAETSATACPVSDPGFDQGVVQNATKLTDLFHNCFVRVSQTICTRSRGVRTDLSVIVRATEDLIIHH